LRWGRAERDHQAVAAARAASAETTVQLLSKVGEDVFGAMGRALWKAEGIDAGLVASCAAATGAAAILLDEAKGENAIIVVPGACFTLTPEEVLGAADALRGAAVFLAQMELPVATVERGLSLARAAGVPTILNPAPATELPDALLALVDTLIPNETEAAMLSGLPVESVEEAERAARRLLERGPGCVIVTMGERGALLCERTGEAVLIPAVHAAPVVETTGAGDGFCGGFAVAIAEGMELREAVRFGCVAAGISVTRAGTAPSMPRRAEIDALLR
jgi:ribokinase